jgi:hypothetical protein
MTSKIISGIAVAAIVLALGMGTQISAFAMTDPQTDAAKKIASQTFGSTDSMMLVAISPAHKGGKATLMLVPRPAENVDGIPTPKSSPDLIMVTHPSPTGGKPIFTWIPRPTPSLADYSS